MANLTGAFFLDALSIILIDVLLAGDNAVVIAMAVKSLPPEQRRTGVAAGAAGAVVLRVALTFFAVRLLQLEFLTLGGGLLIFWIAVRLLISGTGEQEAGGSAASLRQAIWMILVADLTMSLDNILAVAAASKGNLALLITGLGLSISFVVFASSILSRVMDRYPILIWLGAAILGRVAGGMILIDPWIVRMLHSSRENQIAAEICGAVLVVLLGGTLKMWKKRKNSAAPSV